MMSIYNFTVTLEDGTSYSLDKYKNQPMIIVNTATKCGLAPQFEQLEELYERYQSQGLIILGFLLTNSNKKLLLPAMPLKPVEIPMALLFQCIKSLISTVQKQTLFSTI